MQTWPSVVTVLLSFLSGSIPTGWLVARLYRVDIQRTGSGNIGATNVFRVLGKGPGVFVLLVDAAKGYVPARFLAAWVIQWFFEPGATVPAGLVEYLPIAAGFAAILGHVYTPWLRFKGGKGIATAAGVLAAWIPLAFVIALMVWLLVFAVSGYVSLGSITAAAILPLAVWGTKAGTPYVIMSAIIGALAIYKHRANIARLRAGTEARFGRRGSGPAEVRRRDEE